MERVHTLQFVRLDPLAAGEPWAEDAPWCRCVIDILIDGRPLLDTVREIEKPYLRAEGIDLPCGGYGHLPPSVLYRSLTENEQPHGDFGRRGANLFCCADCGEYGCWSVRVHIRREGGAVIWEDFCHEHRKDWA